MEPYWYGCMGRQQRVHVGLRRLVRLVGTALLARSECLSRALGALSDIASNPDRLGRGTLFRLAQQSWPGWTKPTARRRDETTETPPDFVEPDSPERVAPGETTALRGLLSIEAWAARDIPEPDYLLGNLITTTSRAFLVGRTGLGKTMLALAIAVGAASGRGFLNWRSSRPARVLYIDGEMPAELIKARAVDELYVAQRFRYRTATSSSTAAI